MHALRPSATKKRFRRIRLRGNEGASDVGVYRDFLLGHRDRDRMLVEMLDRAPDVVHQQAGHVPADPLADHDAHDGDVLGIAGQGECRNLPAALQQPIGEIVQCIGQLHARLYPEAYRRNTGLRIAVVDELERPELADLFCQPLSRVVAGLLNPPVSLATEAEEVVVLGDDLTGRTGEVDGERTYRRRRDRALKRSAPRASPAFLAIEPSHIRSERDHICGPMR